MEKTLTKNLKDLEYSRTLNRESISVVLVGTLIISVFFTQEELPLHLSRGIWLISLLILTGIMIAHFDKKLKNITEEIKNLQLSK